MVKNAKSGSVPRIAQASAGEGSSEKERGEEMAGEAVDMTADERLARELENKWS